MNHRPLWVRVEIDAANRAWLETRGHIGFHAIGTFLNDLLIQAREDEAQIAEFGVLLRTWLNGDHGEFTRRAELVDEDAWSVFESFLAALASTVVRLRLPPCPTDNDIEDLTGVLFEPASAIDRALIGDIIKGAVGAKPVFDTAYTRARLFMIGRLAAADSHIRDTIETVLAPSPVKEH